MGVSVADFDHDGRFDIVKTNFAGDTSSLYRNLGKNVFEDILACNGHVYPEVGQSNDEQGYAQRKVFYRNLRNGRFADVSLESGAGIRELASARGCAFGDPDNDGDLDVLINCVNDVPQLLRCDNTLGNNWLKVKLSAPRATARASARASNARRQTA